MKVTCYTEVRCPQCDSHETNRAGKSAAGEQRYRCCNATCSTNTFLLLNYRYTAWKPGIKNQVIDMAINGSGIRDTACVLKINKNTVISTLKKIPNSSESEPQL